MDDSSGDHNEEDHSGEEAEAQREGDLAELDVSDQEERGDDNDEANHSSATTSDDDDDDDDASSDTISSVDGMKRFLMEWIDEDDRLDLEPFLETLRSTVSQRLFIEALGQCTSLRSIQIPFGFKNFLLCEELTTFCRTSPSLRVCGFVHGLFRLTHLVSIHSHSRKW